MFTRLNLNRLSIDKNTRNLERDPTVISYEADKQHFIVYMLFVECKTKRYITL